MADGKVVFELELRQKGDKVQIVQRQTEKLADSTENLDRKRRKLNKTTDAYNRREKGAAQISSNSTKNFSKMAQNIDGGGGSGGLVRAYALLAANVFALSAAFGILSRSAQIDTLTESMRQLEIVSGKSIVSVARNLQEASGFGMNFAESMRAVSLATSAGFGSAQIEQLGQVARNAAVSLGRNLPDALDRIFRGVIKVEPELLDEIGLFVRVNDAAGKYASSIGVAAGDLTEFQKRQAFLNEAIAQGTSKFEAFASVENDPFALLATTFADMSHEVLSFLNNAIGPLVRMLAENKVLFATVFAGLTGALLKLAVPAMGAFTQSIAANAASTSAAATAAKTEAETRAKMARDEHAEFLKMEREKAEARANAAGLRTRRGAQGQIAVRGKKESRELENSLKKELGFKNRIALVDQRIKDIESKRGKEKRLQNKAIQEELALLKAERAEHQQILALKQQEANIDNAEIIRADSVVTMTALNAKNAALKADSLATVANTAQTQGARAALRQLRLEINALTQAKVFGTGVTGAFSKALFALKGGAVTAGVAIQGLMMKIMGPLSLFLLFLPVLQGINKALGVGSAASEELTKANKASAEAAELLGPRLEHVKAQLEKIGEDPKAYNQGMESFKNTVLTTTSSIIEQEAAFNTYMNSASGWAIFWGETLPGLFGGGTAAAIRRGKKAIIEEMRAMGDDVTPAMKKALEELQKAQDDALAAYDPASNTSDAALDELAKARGQDVVDLAKEEAEAYINVRSAIQGAADSARAFSDSLVVTTVVDKPLNTMRQLEKSLANVNLTEKERIGLVNEIAKDTAVLALLTKEQRMILQDTFLTEKDRRLAIAQARTEFERQQIVLIRNISLQKLSAELAKNIASTTKVSTAAIGKTFEIEKQRTANDVKAAEFAATNARIATDLTKEELIRLRNGEELKDIVDEERFLKADLKAIHGALNKLTEEEIVLMRQKFEIATRAARQTKAEAEARLNAIKDEETINKQVLARANLEDKIASFKQTGSTNRTTLQQLQRMIREETSLQKTRQRRAKEEGIIAKANKEIEARKMDTLALQAEEGSKEQKRYEDAAKALRKAGEDIEQSILDGAEDAAKVFKQNLSDLFTKTIPGSSVGDDALNKGLAGTIASGIGIIGAKGEDGKDIFNDAEKAAMGFKLMEESLLSMADTIESVLGEDGALLAGLARATAGFVSLGTSYAAAMETADTTSERVAAGASAIAAGLGQIMSLVSAQAQQNVREIDQMIEAEKRRDGKSKESVAKMQALEKKKEQVQRKAFEVNKKLMIAQAIASTAAGIAATLPLLANPFTAGIAAALMAMIAGIGAAQVAIISKLTFAGGGATDTASAAPQQITVGKRNERVDVAKGATAGELAYLRGEQGVGSNANNFTPAGAAGMKRSYASGGEIMVGERGPEIIQPTSEGFNVVPNDKMGGQNLNANITINAVDAAGVEDVLMNQRGNIISMIREAAHEHGEEFIEGVNTSSYTGGSGG